MTGNQTQRYGNDRHPSMIRFLVWTAFSMKSQEWSDPLEDGAGADTYLDDALTTGDAQQMRGQVAPPRNNGHSSSMEAPRTRALWPRWLSVRERGSPC